MTLDFFNKLWLCINNLSNSTKTLIIIVLLFFSLCKFTYFSLENIITDKIEYITNQNQKAEQYTLSIAPQINNCVQSIVDRDDDCYDVLLLNYHNSTESLQGFKYVYLNCISEKSRDVTADSNKELWHNLDYMEFEEELTKIHNHGYLRIQDIDSVYRNFPRLCKKLKLSGAKAAGFYPIEGVESPIGMIVVLYNKPKHYSQAYFNLTIAPSIQKLAVLLDYPYMKTKQK